jgi:hypothetical protein
MMGHFPVEVVMVSGWEHVRSIGSVLSILGVGAGLAIYFTDFKTRLEKLESQVQLIAVAPTVVRIDQPGTTNRPPEKGGTLNTLEPYAEPFANPLIATCVDLMKRTATAKEKNQFTAEVSLDSLLRDYGCKDLMNRLSKN